MWNVRFNKNRGGSRLDLAVWLSREIQSWDNRMASYPVLSCSAPASMTVHLLGCLACVLHLAACSHEIKPRVSVFLHTLEQSTLYLTHYPYNKTHLNTGLLNAEIQVNLAHNKANKMVNQIQPYSYYNMSIQITALPPPIFRGLHESHSIFWICFFSEKWYKIDK